MAAAVYGCTSLKAVSFPIVYATALCLAISACLRNLTCVHLLCPHLLRYYAVYAIMNRKRKDHFQAIVGVRECADEQRGPIVASNRRASSVREEARRHL